MPTPSILHPPVLFSQVKTHKAGNPLRPIISKCKAPTINAERALAKFIAPHLADHPHTLRSTQHFLEIFKPLMTLTSLHLFTADVNSLFPSIPLPLVSSLLHDVFSLITPSTSQISWLSSLSDLLLHNNYFCFGPNLFLQTTGTPMGSPLSSSLAEITMQNLETSILPHFSEFFTLHWYRYVDDIFILTNASQDTIQTIFDKMTEHTPRSPSPSNLNMTIN